MAQMPPSPLSWSRTRWTLGPTGNGCQSYLAWAYCRFCSWRLLGQRRSGLYRRGGRGIRFMMRHSNDGARDDGIMLIAVRTARDAERHQDNRLEGCPFVQFKNK